MLAAPQKAARSRPSALITFTGFTRADQQQLGVTTSGSTSLQAHVRAITRRSGVRCLRVTRMMFERFTEKAIKVR